MVEDRVKLGLAAGLAGAAATLAAIGLYKRFFGSDDSSERPPSLGRQPTTQIDAEDEFGGELVAVIGDVGGTNVRLTLRKLDLRTRTSTEVKPLTKIASQGCKNFADALTQFLTVSALSFFVAWLMCNMSWIGHREGLTQLAQNRSRRHRRRGQEQCSLHNKHPALEAD